MFALRRLLLQVATALALVATCSRAPTTADARMIPWSADLRTSLHRTFDSAKQLQTQWEASIREGRFPKAGRSIAAKIHEANAFLDRELGNSDVAGVGSSAAIVYKDKVVLSKGYGLRTANDNSSHVTTSTLFQIGSVTKTFVALGIAILVDEGKVAWRDPVIKHLPTLELFDKYAEKYVTIGDLLAMNSGLGAALDLGWVFGLYQTDKKIFSALRDAPPAHSLRSKYEYANSNFAILGELIERVSGLEWDAFLKKRIWDPLGMKRTFASAMDAKDDKDMSAGHVSCGGEVFGPYHLVTSPEAQLVRGGTGSKLAAGSVVSSADDMAKLLRLLLNKGSVDGVTILRSPSLVSEMTSGKSIVDAEMTEMFIKGGHQFVPDGNTLAAGYGFDFISPASWGHAYYDKSGDTEQHQTRTGFIPDDEKLGVIIMANSQLPTPHGNFIIDHVRSYIIGIFLDVPTAMLDLAFTQWRADDALQPVLPDTPVCGLDFWKNPPDLELDARDVQAMVGSYVVLEAPKYFGTLEVTAQSATRLHVRNGKLEASLQFIQDLGEDQGKLFLVRIGGSRGLLQIVKNASDGKYEINFGVLFKQQ